MCLCQSARPICGNGRRSISEISGDPAAYGDGAVLPGAPGKAAVGSDAVMVVENFNCMFRYPYINTDGKNYSRYYRFTLSPSGSSFRSLVMAL